MIVTICLVLLAIAAMPLWGPILLLGLVAFGHLLLALVCWPFAAVDRWKRRRGYGRSRHY